MGESIFRGEFPKEVIEQAAVASKLRISAYMAKRLDLRSKTILCFASSEATPAECGFSLYKKASGWELGVHIADVCEYVCEGSPLDEEARKRYAAITNAGEESGMLPEMITHEVCDLASGGDKLALSVLLDLDADGALKSLQLEESVVRVAEKCIYSEIDQLELAKDSSSVMFLREKYAALIDILINMYELAAKYCCIRRARGGLDNIFFKKVYERNIEGNITSFRRESEPDSRAMVREIGYFIANAIGQYFIERKMPCIFIGQAALPEYTMNYLSGLLGVKNGKASVAELDDLAKGTPYYNLVTDTIMGSMPCPIFSDGPIENVLCASDKIVSVFRPATRYTDLLSLRALKTCISAGGNPQNLNLKRQKKINSEAAVEASKAEQFVYKTRQKISRTNALEYIKNCGDSPQMGYPIMKMPEGTVRVILDCGVKAIIPPEAAAGFSFEPAMPYLFDILNMGMVDRYTLVRPHK